MEESNDTSLDEEDQVIQEYVDSMDPSNIQEHIHNAKELMQQQDFFNASLLWRAIIIKGIEIYGSDKAYELA